MRHPKKEWDKALDRLAAKANKQAEDWDTALDRIAAEANKQAEDHERENKNDWPNVSDQMADETSPERENEASINSVANEEAAVRRVLGKVEDLLDEKSQTLKRNADKSDLLEYWRCKAADGSDACNVASILFHKELIDTTSQQLSTEPHANHRDDQQTNDESEVAKKPNSKSRRALIFPLARSACVPRLPRPR